ncbi:MAG: GumC domain-containing protein [Planctomycetota bacterium]
MNSKRIIWTWLSLTVLTCVLMEDISMAAPHYTAKTFIKVLPYADEDPTKIAAPMVKRDIQYAYRMSVAALLKHQNTLEQLIDRNAVQETNWFRSFGDPQRDKAECVRKALNDLQDNLQAVPKRDTEFVEVAMTSTDPAEAAQIVNELVDLFVSTQTMTAQSQIQQRLANLDQERRRIKRELDAAEAALDEVRRRWGLSGLDEPVWRHPAAVRIIRLQEKKDELVLEIAGVRAVLQNLEERGGAPDQVKDELIVLQSKLEALHQMLAEAEADRKELDAAQVQYGQRAAIRNERRRRLQDVMLLIEKLKIVHRDPRIAKVQSVGPAAIPLEPDTR